MEDCGHAPGHRGQQRAPHLSLRKPSSPNAQSMASLHRIVVGVDFGTTYTAAAWAETSNPDHVEVVQNWPTSGQLVGMQAPSEIAYADGDTSQFSWGYSITPRERKVRPSQIFLSGH